jgi:hypothetical protein
MKVKNELLYFVSGVLVCLLFFKACDGKSNSETKIVTKTKVVKVTDTLRPKDKIVTKYKNVYLKKTDTSVVYVTEKDSSTIEARLYEQPIVGKRSTGLAKITTTGELLDFSVVIQCQDSIIETTKTQYKNKSKLFLSGELSTNKDVKAGLDWNIKNKVLLKGGVGYNINTNAPYISVGVGIPIF